MNARRAPVLAVVASLVAGCSGDMSDLHAWVAEIKQRPAVRIAPLPQVKPYETFVYTAHDQRDPFTPSAQVRPQLDNLTGEGIRPDGDRHRQFLEEFPLDTLRMVGTVTMGGETFGLILDTEGAVHRVRVGDYLGQNHGRINAIAETSISLNEIIPDGMGGWIERRAAVALSE